ncbi:MAG: DUF3500 domain-containing protein [Planctomycetes bacterium]|nr:DUF3500 domain-containing protein [Planctomycetota bacterium]
MSEKRIPNYCPDCDESLTRRAFMATAGSAALTAGALPIFAMPRHISAAEKGAPETVVKALYDSLNEQQRTQICFNWDHVGPGQGLLRTRVSNNWNITKPTVNSDFYTNEQRAMIREIFEGIIQPDWHARIDKQLKDDAGGFGQRQSIAIFGKPGGGKFEFVLTGRHMTLRCDGNSEPHVAFGGPIFYGHAAAGFNEPADHRGNVYWHQALAANKIYTTLDGRQQKIALVEQLPAEEAVGFRAPDGKYPGIAVTDLSSDQREALQKVLSLLLEPYRQSDRDEALGCLKTQGGLDRCSLAFYKAGDIGGDGVWDCWRVEGPSFVWYFRGAPHVHVWVHVADDAKVQLNA